MEAAIVSKRNKKWLMQTFCSHLPQKILAFLRIKGRCYTDQKTPPQRGKTETTATLC